MQESQAIDQVPDSFYGTTELPLWHFVERGPGASSKEGLGRVFFNIHM